MKKLMKKEKGKMKREKVPVLRSLGAGGWMSLLLTFSLLLFTSAAPATESAMAVADGATVALIIPSGVEVSLTGGSANGVTGAGAGIEVPVGATLNIAGAGKLYAYGGKAADGANGEQGTTPASYDSSSEKSTAASGGAGGNGGGAGGSG